jgi:hypothetical protein
VPGGLPLDVDDVVLIVPECLAVGILERDLAESEVLNPRHLRSL